MIGHILFDVPVGYPLQHQFQQPLPIHLAAHVLVTQADAGAVAFGEMPLGIRRTWPPAATGTDARVSEVKGGPFTSEREGGNERSS